MCCSIHGIGGAQMIERRTSVPTLVCLGVYDSLANPTEVHPTQYSRSFVFIVQNSISVRLNGNSCTFSLIDSGYFTASILLYILLLRTRLFNFSLYLGILFNLFGFFGLCPHNHSHFTRVARR